MANYELVGLNETGPDLRAPTASDTGTVAGDLAVSGTAIVGTAFGIGVTPSAWDVSQKAIDIGYSGAIKSSSGSGSVVSITNNAYYGSSGWAYKVTGMAAGLYDIRDTGAHVFYSAAGGTAGAAIPFSVQWEIDSNNDFIPGTDNAYSIGNGSKRPDVIYAASGTINTSDAREKTPLRSLTDNEILAAKALGKEIGAYVFLSAREEKGDAAREHIGMTVQKAIEILESFDLNPFNYGFICYDEWDEVTEEVDGEIVVKQEAGNRYSFRTDELALFILAGLSA